MAFVPNRRFDSAAEAFDFICYRYALQRSVRLWLETGSGLVVPHDAPQYLFRGECGDFETTMSAIQRPATYKLKDGRPLAALDVQLLQEMIPDFARRFCDDGYRLEEHNAIGLLQHYGLPTWMVDFTAHPGYAFAFAAAGTSMLGRVAVMPLNAFPMTGGVVNLTEHPWAERPRRQEAFGLIMTDGMDDLKSEAARSRLNLCWYEFPVSRSDQDCLMDRYEKLVGLSEDPSAGFLRFHITEYVEAHGKFSPELTDWLLERVPIAPRCFMVKAVEAGDVVLNFRGADVLPDFDPAVEVEKSRAYWSSDHGDSSWNRREDWAWPQPGLIGADPRTYHPNP